MGLFDFIGDLIFGKSDAPDYNFDPAQIDKLIKAYRESGMAGLRSLGMQEQTNAVSRLAQSGMAPTLGMQQALFMPIFEQLAGARSGLEGQLAGTEFGARQHMADMQFSSDMAGWENRQNQIAGLTDLLGTGGLGLLFGRGGNSNPYSDWWLSKSMPTSGGTGWGLAG